MDIRRARADELNEYVRALTEVKPSNFDHHPAIRCAIGVGIPLAILAASGHPELIPFGSFGALTGVFGRGEPHRVRLRSQLFAAALLVGAVAMGLLLGAEGAPWQTVVGGASIVAFVGALLSGAADLRPAGSMFYVLAYAATVFISPSAAAAPLVVTIASAALSLFIGTAGWVLPGHQTPWEAKPLTWPGVARWREIATDALVHLAAVGVAGSAAALLGLSHINWAMLTATVPLVGVSTQHRLNRGVQRILGTLGGLLIAALIFLAEPSAAFMLGALVVLQFLIELYVTRNYALGQVFATPYSLLLIEVSHPSSPWALVAERGVETLVGALVGIGFVVTGTWIQQRRQ